jgi:hypothetical protein
MRIIIACMVLAHRLVAVDLTKLPPAATDQTQKPPVANPDHWAFKSPVRPAEPVVKNKGWPRNSIDRFVLARLEQFPAAAPSESAAGQVSEGRKDQEQRRSRETPLQPSPEADRSTLIRRLSSI